MADRWVINASPVILLAKAEVIRFLPQLCDELVIPAGVVGEVRNVHITQCEICPGQTARSWGLGQ